VTVSTHPGDSAPIRHGGPVSPSGPKGGVVLSKSGTSSLAAEGNRVRAALCDGLPVQAPAGHCPPAGAPRRGHARLSRSAFIAMWNDPAATTDEIAERFGLYRTSVTPLGYRMGLPPRKTGAKPKVCRATFTALWLAKVSTIEISRAMGIGRNYAGVLAQRFGLAKRPQGMRGSITMADYRALQLREALAAKAREEQAALRLCEMVDGSPRTRRAA